MSEDPLPAHRLSLERIERSAGVIPRVFLHSPQYNCEPLSGALECALTIKLDVANPIRSFKGRGASFFVHELRRRGDARRLVCASAGNWGQALAYACRAHGMPLLIYASRHASPLKVARMRGLGATVCQEGEDFDAAKAVARRWAGDHNAWLVEDGLEPEISEGHGTLAMELLAGDARFDLVVVPLGNGAMLTGMARWIKAVSPSTQVVGVCATGAPAMEQSWRSGSIVETGQADTIADGIAVRVPIPEAVGDMTGLVDQVMLVDDGDVIEGMRLAWEHAGVMLEPAGAAGLAAIVAHPGEFAGRRVATVLSGSNITPGQFAERVAGTGGEDT